MSKDILEMSDGTLRQRRNLLSVTVALIIIHHGNVIFGGDLKLFGASVTIQNPEVIIIIINFVQAYFLWRFYQYFHTDGAYVTLKSQYQAALNGKFDKIVMNHIFRSLPKGVTSVNGSYSYSDISRTDDSGGCFEVKVGYSTGPNKEDFNLSEMVVIPTNLFKWQKIPVQIAFFFRGRILTDFYLPFLLVVYSLVCNFV